uniref:E3 ubiquitin-protein ligase TRIM7-like isoform X1 n=1 Tax=Pogona vitticeps TaxID=103695 RepID=A0ABM5FHE6_9SAUR
MAAAAAASLQGFCEEATCSICLEYFEDPVTIECGHNFCRACLTQSWEGSGVEEISCPQCREKVPRNLIPNRLLGNFVELTKKLSLQGETSPTEGKGKTCGKHREPLKLFCKEDQAPICVVCDRSKEHRNHDVVPLEEAAQDYKDLICSRLEVLEKERANILACKAETEEESQELLKQTKAEMEKTKEHFGDLHCFLNEQEKLLLAQLEEVEKEITRKRDDHLARLSGELCCLGGLIREMEEKRQQPPDELLQDVRNLLQRCEKKEPFQNPVAFPPELKRRFWEACDRNPFLAKKMKQFRDTLLPGSQLQKGNVTLDPKTAHPHLILSEDCKSVRHGDQSQHLPNNPERFNRHYFVLGSEGFTAGRHYWEVTVGGEKSWAVGVARKSMQRKGTIAFDTEQGIWAVGKWRGGYITSGKSFLPLSEKLRRLRVSLNYEGGRVAFHNADTGSHFYTFSGASVSGETLLPFFCVCEKASLTISPEDT